MKTPFEILNISENSNDESVKKAYLTMVKQFPPERCPQEFQQIRGAYENIKTQKKRLLYSLFDSHCPSAEDLIRDISSSARGRRPGSKTLQKLLTVSLRQRKIAE